MNDERQKLIQQMMEAIRQTASHYGLWLAESVHQVGLETALEAEQEAGDRLTGILEHRLCRVLGKKSMEEICAEMDDKTMAELVKSLHTSWLAADGVWFQAIECQAGQRHLLEQICPSGGQADQGAVRSSGKRRAGSTQAGPEQTDVRPHQHLGDRGGNRDLVYLPHEQVQGADSQEPQRHGRLPVQIRRNCGVHELCPRDRSPHRD